MADKSTKEVIVDGAIKLGLSLFIIKLVKDTFSSPPGRTDRVNYDHAATQFSVVSLGDGNYHQVPQEWSPEDLARRLHTEMNGVTSLLPGYIPSGRYAVWGELANLGIERTKWLHNYWLNKIDSKETLYRWIKAEYPRTSEWDKYNSALYMLQRAGVNF